MKTRSPEYLKFVQVLCVVSLLAGCLSSSPSPTFYLLSAMPADPQVFEIASSAKGTADLRIGVGPIELPDHLERPQIVSRTKGNELHVEEFHRWAGSLEKDLSRIMTSDLSASLGTDAVLSFPWTASIPLDYQVEVVVTRFDGVLGGHVDLQARWMVFADDIKSPLLVRTSSLTAASADSSYTSYVAALARLVRQLSREVAVSVAGLEQPQ